MTEKQQKLQRIVELRMKFMHRKWETAHVDTSHSTFIEVSFQRQHPEHTGKTDFRTTRFTPDIDKVIEIQQQKLCRDVEAFIGKGYMDELKAVLA